MWRWPWVPRELYNACQGVANRLLQDRDRAEAQLTEVRKQYDRLVEVALGMKKEGYVPQEPLREPPPEPTLPSVVEEAIAQRAFDPPSIRHLQGWARQALTGAEAEQVAQRILDGEDMEDVV